MHIVKIPQNNIQPSLWAQLLELWYAQTSPIQNTQQTIGNMCCQLRLHNGRFPSPPQPSVWTGKVLRCPVVVARVSVRVRVAWGMERTIVSVELGRRLCWKTCQTNRFLHVLMTLTNWIYTPNLTIRERCCYHCFMRICAFKICLLTPYCR